MISHVLMAAELAQLAERGRLDVSSDRILVADPAPTGDPELDKALAGIVGLASPPRPADWVAQPSAPVLAVYFERLTAAGVIRRRHRWRFSMTWRIVDGPRLAQAQERLDAIARSAGAVGTGQAAFAVLVHAAGLDRRLYRGKAHHSELQRLREVAEGHWTAGPGQFAGTMAPTGTPGLAGLPTAQSAVLAAAHAAVDAATQATLQAILDSAATG